MSRFQKWALATTIATYFLIMLGGLVRASGAGLGCPNWPKCFDRYYPPLSADQIPREYDPELFNVQLAWIEYINRMIGVLIGFLIIGTLYYAIKDHRENKRIVYPAITSFVLVLFQGWLGGQVVEQELVPWLVTAHLVLALIIVSLLLYATVGAFFPDVKKLREMSIDRRRLAWIALAVLVITLTQIGLGAKLRGDLENVEENNPELARSSLIEEAGWSDAIHRSYSWLVLGTVLFTTFYTHRRMSHKHPLLIWLSRAMVAIVVLQVLVGIGLAYGGLPPALQVIHLINASVLVGVITMVYLLTNRLPLLADVAQGGRAQAILSRETALR
ncbi:MAG: COX15/CtaA family protein [Chloroflexi bacterium]|nr:COX15/CtaA family protein [Chloroflexota bacterium]